MVFGAAARLLEDPSSAEQVVEHIFLALWRGAPGLEPAQTSLWPWLLAQLLRFARAARSPSQARYRGLDGSVAADDEAAGHSRGS